MTDYNYTNKQQKELKVCKFYQLDLAIPMSKEMSREMQI